MRTLVFSAVALLCLGFMSVTPSAAAPGAWQCMSPAFACGDAPSVKRHRAKRYVNKGERRHRSAQKRSRKHVSKNTSSKPAAQRVAKATEAVAPKRESKPATTAAAKPDMPERKLTAIGDKKVESNKARTADAGKYRVRSRQTGIASYYWQPQRVASGGYFNPNAMTAAHRTLPFGTKVRVTNKRNGKSVVVTINDRGPFIRGRVIDLSKAAAGVIGMQGAGLAPVVVERLAAN